MSNYFPYHEGIVQFLGALDPLEEGYPIRLKTIAELAGTLRVPKEHRKTVSEAFAGEIEHLEESWTQDDVDDVAPACRAVGDAMREQDAEDVAKERQAQQ